MAPKGDMRGPLASASAGQPATVGCLCLGRWCSLACHLCRRIVPPDPAPGHGQSAFGLNKAPLRRLTHEISAAASSPPGSPPTPASAPAAFSASGQCTPVCSGSLSGLLCLIALYTVSGHSVLSLGQSVLCIAAICTFLGFCYSVQDGTGMSLAKQALWRCGVAPLARAIMSSQSTSL